MVVVRSHSLPGIALPLAGGALFTLLVGVWLTSGWWFISNNGFPSPWYVLARIDRILAPLTWLAAAFAVLVLFVGPTLIGAKKDGGATAGAPAGTAAAPSGKEVFASAGCGGCHTLAAAGSSGTTGPNLDDAKPSADTRRGDRDLRCGDHAVVQGAPVGGRDQGRRAVRVRDGAGRQGDRAARGDARPTSPRSRPRSRPAAARTASRSPAPTSGSPTPAPARCSASTPAPTAAPARPSRPAGSPTTRSSRTRAVWVVASGDDAVLRIMNGRTTAIPVGRAPEALAVGERFLWVTNAGDGTVSRIDPDTARVSGDPIKVGGRPLDIAAGKDAVWVTSFTDGTVTRLDPRSGDVQGEPIRVGRHPRGVAVGEGSVWVANAGDGTVTRIDPAKAAVVGDPIPVGQDPRELEVGEGFVWVANAGDGTVTRIDPSGQGRGRADRGRRGPDRDRGRRGRGVDRELPGRDRHADPALGSASGSGRSRDQRREPTLWTAGAARATRPPGTVRPGR